MLCRRNFLTTVFALACAPVARMAMALTRNAGTWPESARALKRIRRQPWTPAQLNALVSAATRLPGHVTAVSGEHLAAGPLMAALLRVSYLTGLRTNELLAIRTADVQGGQLVVRRQKTGQVLRMTVRENVLEAIAAMEPGQRELLFPIEPRSYYRLFCQVAKNAGLKSLLAGRRDAFSLRQ